MESDSHNTLAAPAENGRESPTAAQTAQIQPPVPPASDGAPAAVDEPAEPHPRFEPWMPSDGRESSERSPDAALSPAATTLPAAPPWADLAQTRVHKAWMLLCFGAAFALYVALIPQFTLHSGPPTGDQPFYLMDVVSLAQDADLNVKNNYDNSDFDKFYALGPHPPGSPGFAGISAPYPLPRQLADAKARPTTEQYSAHLPGLPFLLVPAWIVGGWFRLWWPATIVVTCFLGALLGLNVFLLAHQMTGRVWIAFCVWLPIAFSGPIMTYSYLLFTEMPVGLLLIYAFRRLAMGWGANEVWRLLLVGWCIGYIPWLSLRCLPISAVLGLYALVQWWRYWRYRRYERTKPLPTNEELLALPVVTPGQPVDNVASAPYTVATEPHDKRHSAFRVPHSALGPVFFLAPVLISAALMLWFNEFKFGVLLPSATSSEAGRTDHFYWPWGGPSDLARFTTSAYGLLFDNNFGLFTYAPIYLLAAVGIIAMFRLGRRSDRRLLLWIAIAAIPYMTLITGYEAWHGVWCPPARYISSFVPLMAAPLSISLFALSRNRLTGAIYGLIYAAMSIPGFVAAAIMVNDSRLMWPLGDAAAYGWLAGDESSPLHLDVRRWLTSFDRPDELLHPLFSARLAGAALAIVLVSYFLMVLQRSTRAERRFPFAAQGLVWVGALSLLGSSWFVMNNDFLKHKTILVEQRRWNLAPAPNEPYGIGYLNSKIYVPAYVRGGQGTVGELDLNTGAYNLITPLLPEGPSHFAHPSDIKAGPDGLLYVLNNGDGSDALWVMQPDGKVVRRIALNGKTPIATGLYLGPDGSYYIADMLGGATSKYTPQGGNPLGVWGGMNKGFNNCSGAAVAQDGNIYVAEGSYKRIQVLAPDGHFVRKYEFVCSPIHVTVNGDWVDATCDNGLVSIDTKTQNVQLSIFQGTRPNTPTGLVYGSDNTTLYIMDGASVAEYKLSR